jgi:glucosamine 6-phosphate synthetase-like amidotransferase/phosphosugar isomerase protein
VKNVCGIAGYTTTKNSDKRVQKIFSKMLSLSSARGRDATGMVITTERGRMGVMKAPITSPEFINSPNFSKTMQENPVSVIGHVRFATTGTPRRNENNHPIVAGKIVGVHNGVICNVKELTEDYDLNRAAEVDSEVVFLLLDRIKKLDHSSIKRMLSLLSGTYTLVFQSIKEPNKIWLVKGPERPLVLGFDSRLQTTWFASEERFIMDSYRFHRISRAGLNVRDMRTGEIIELDTVAERRLAQNVQK